MVTVTIAPYLRWLGDGKHDMFFFFLIHIGDIDHTRIFFLMMGIYGYINN